MALIAMEKEQEDVKAPLVVEPEVETATLLSSAPAAASAALPEPKAPSSSSTKFKKAPDAPKRFKSAFIIFSAEKHKEIKEELLSQGRSEKTTDIAKLVSEAWREMSAEEKQSWETKARKDKARYEVEKALYKGPWKIPANKRMPKDPTAPKRPMSAFLAFSNKRRAALKRQHPDATNADLSKMLSKTWREAPDELRRKYMDEEAGLRAHYKVEMAKWRKKVAEEKKAERKEREAMALQAAEARQHEKQMPPNDMMQQQQQQQQHHQFAQMANPDGSQQQQQQQPLYMYNQFGGQVGGGLQGALDFNSGYNLMQAGFPAPFLGAPVTQQQLIQQLLGQQILSANPMAQRVMYQPQGGGQGGPPGGATGMQGQSMTGNMQQAAQQQAQQQAQQGYGGMSQQPGLGYGGMSGMFEQQQQQQAAMGLQGFGSMSGQDAMGQQSNRSEEGKEEGMQGGNAGNGDLKPFARPM